MTMSFHTAACAAALLLAGCAHAQGAASYPARPIRVIVSVPAGGGVDTVTRLVAQKLQERLGQPVVIENRGGAAGNIGAEAVANAPPDGYTLLVCDTAHTIQPVLQKLEYDPIKSFSLIASLVSGDSMLVVPANVAAANIKQFIALDGSAGIVQAQP